jgi:hypothetical protein
MEGIYVLATSMVVKMHVEVIPEGHSCVKEKIRVHGSWLVLSHGDINAARHSEYMLILFIMKTGLSLIMDTILNQSQLQHHLLHKIYLLLVHVNQLLINMELFIPKANSVI